jgi:hypothetical protein
MRETMETGGKDDVIIRNWEKLLKMRLSPNVLANVVEVLGVIFQTSNNGIIESFARSGLQPLSFDAFLISTVSR